MASSISPDKAIAAPAHSPDSPEPNACLQVLPPKFLGHIAEYLTPPDCGRLQATSHAFYHEVHEVSVSQYDSACNLASLMNEAVPSVDHRALAGLDPSFDLPDIPHSESQGMNRLIWEQFNAFKIKQGLRSMYKLRKLLPRSPELNTDELRVGAYKLKQELSLMHFTSALPDNCLGDLLARINLRRSGTPLTRDELKSDLKQQTPLYITEIRQWFDDPTSSIRIRRDLELSGQGLKSIPYEIGKLTNLRELCLDGNKLSELPDTIGSLVNLEELYLSCNELSKLPDTIGSLVKLRILYLGRNKLSKLPYTIGSLVKLEELRLDGNKLSELPYTIGQLKNLQELCLNDNKLRELPYTIGQLKNLEVLWLNDNKLRELPYTITIGDLRNLQELHLDGNELRA